MTIASDTDNLLHRIQSGDNQAVDELFRRYRKRLRRLVSMRLDHRMSRRIDASDVVQDSLAKASKRIGEYAQTQPIPFYPWLRKLAIERIVELHRDHIQAQRRSVDRECVPNANLSSFGRDALVQRLVSMSDSPSRRVRLREDVERAQLAMEKLSDVDREVLVLRYLEQLTPKEAAAVMEITENAFAQRHLRALRRVRALLDFGGEDDG